MASDVAVMESATGEVTKDNSKTTSSKQADKLQEDPRTNDDNAKDISPKGSGQIKESTAESSKSTAPQEEKKLSVMEAHGYLLGTVLGTGSYATVKMAFSSRHKCKVAVKIISKKKSPASYVNKFLPREIDAVRILKHPNIICFLQSIETTNRVYLIMEVASGGDVLKSIRASKHIEESNAGMWFGQCTGAIQYCHLKGVVHRDLKCENLLLDSANNIKITDFGFARVYDRSQPMDPSNTFCGSYPYAPPEILRGIPYHPPSADIWSMGVILFTMVFGRLPFDDHNHRTLVKQVMAGPQFPVRHSYQLQVSDACRELIIKILKPMPNRASFETIEKDGWFVKYCASSMHMKSSKDNASLMEVLKEEESTESQDVFAEF
ncbi:testis-specific serine/threonine-protein kinase 4-like [Pollicipes pollicipes]|uniref:testis-specific serine/threonine-protein kinase 4-like n=1 Tax=Pollicipes pollicipes TaxID=41117 RepID=UPI001884D292|nr:testis-specific serine/threonine-protein kinase 4-like [Pollicipes pollicipes]